jgi:hypothetical protein
MRPRPAAIILIVVVLALGAARIAGAQGAGPDAVHPLVGTWLIDTDVDDPENPPEVDVFTADGGIVGVAANGDVTAGVWEATGDNTATVTFVTPEGEEEAYFGLFMVRASVEIDESGDGFEGTYTFDIIDPDGNATGEYGPGGVSATRISAEAPGEPIGTLDDLFGLFEEGATPQP